MEPKEPPTEKYNYCPKRVALNIEIGKFSLQKRPETYSRCWDIFSLIQDENGEELEGFVQCRACKKVLLFNPYQRSNLVKHLCYIEKFVRKRKNLQTGNIEIGNKNLTKLLTKWLINDRRSSSVLQDTGLLAVFKELISYGAKFGTYINYDQILPSPTTVAVNVTGIYEECLKKVKAEIAEIKNNGFALTIDIRTDAFSQKTFLAVTMNYLKKGQLTTCLLGLKLVDGDTNTSQQIYEAVDGILKNFDCELSEKYIIITSSDENIMDTFQNISNLLCISFLLNNALQKSLEEVPEIIELARACVNLENYLKLSAENSSCTNELHCNYPLRWNTIYTTLKSIENNWNTISQTLENEKNNPEFEIINISNIKSFTKTLQPFLEAIDALEEENAATLPLVIPYLHELKKSCDINDSEFKDFEFIESLKGNLGLSLDTILYENITILHKIALFLYPPAKKLLPFSKKEKKYIEDECKLLCHVDELNVNLKRETEPSTFVSKRRKIFSDFIEPETNQNPNDLFTQELQCYKNIRVKYSENFDCVSWWEMHKEVFPILYKLSCLILATPASSTATQHIFSSAATLLSGMSSDSKLSETDAEKIMFVNINGDHDGVDIMCVSNLQN